MPVTKKKAAPSLRKSVKSKKYVSKGIPKLSANFGRAPRITFPGVVLQTDSSVGEDKRGRRYKKFNHVVWLSDENRKKFISCVKELDLGPAATDAIKRAVNTAQTQDGEDIEIVFMGQLVYKKDDIVDVDVGEEAVFTARLTIKDSTADFAKDGEKMCFINLEKAEVSETEVEEDIDEEGESSESEEDEAVSAEKEEVEAEDEEDNGWG